MASAGELRARVRGRVWQAFAQSGAMAPADGDAVTLSKDKIEALVDEITDGALAETTAVSEGDVAGAATRTAAGAARVQPEDEEQTLWRGKPLLSLVERYEITSQRLRIVQGLLGRDREDIELLRVQDVDHSQRFVERVLGIGDVTVRSADPSHPEATLRNVRDPAEVHEIIRRATLAARKSSNFSFREEM